MGRFTSPDPSRKSTRKGNPRSWNRYPYVQGDPINATDRHGLNVDACDEGDDDCCDDYGGNCRSSNGGGGEGGGGAGDGGDDETDCDVNPAYCYSAEVTAKLDELETEEADTYEPQGRRNRNGPLQVTNLTKAGSQYNRVLAQLNWILDNITADCLTFLQSGGVNLGSYVRGLTSGYVAVGSFDTGIAAFTGTGGTNVPAGYAAIIFNSGGVFFNSTNASGQTLTVGPNLQGGSAAAQVFTILHELAHALNSSGFLSDCQNQAAGRTNDQLIQTNCAGTYNAAH